MDNLKLYDLFPYNLNNDDVIPFSFPFLILLSSIIICWVFFLFFYFYLPRFFDVLFRDLLQIDRDFLKLFIIKRFHLLFFFSYFYFLGLIIPSVAPNYVLFYFLYPIFLKRISFLDSIMNFINHLILNFIFQLSFSLLDRHIYPLFFDGLNDFEIFGIFLV